MQLNSKKELTPVLYGDSAVKILPAHPIEPNRLCFDTHWHERMELLFVRMGSLEAHIGNQDVLAPAPSLVIVPPGTPHRSVAGAEGVSYYTLMFDIANFRNSAHAADRLLPQILEQKLRFQPVTREPQILALTEALLNEQLSGAGAGDVYSPLVVIGRVYELLGLLCRYCRTDSPGSAVTDDRLRQVLEYLAAHAAEEELSTAALSRRFGYEEAYFCRRFKAVTGLPPMRYICILRLERARRLLKEEEQLRVADVAVACGFTDPGYFTRCFRRHFDMTPVEYRRRLQQALDR